VHQLSDATVSQSVFPSNKTNEQIKEVKKGFAGACRKAGILMAWEYAVELHSTLYVTGLVLDLKSLESARQSVATSWGMNRKDITDEYTHSTIEMRRRAVARLCEPWGVHLASIQEMSGKRLRSKNWMQPRKS